jgi:hypothetical protein
LVASRPLPPKGREQGGSFFARREASTSLWLLVKRDVSFTLKGRKEEKVKKKGKGESYLFLSE